MSWNVRSMRGGGVWLNGRIWLTLDTTCGFIGLDMVCRDLVGVLSLVSLGIENRMGNS